MGVFAEDLMLDYNHAGTAGEDGVWNVMTFVYSGMPGKGGGLYNEASCSINIQQLF